MVHLIKLELLTFLTCMMTDRACDETIHEIPTISHRIKNDGRNITYF